MINKVKVALVHCMITHTLILIYLHTQSNMTSREPATNPPYHTFKSLYYDEYCSAFFIHSYSHTCWVYKTSYTEESRTVPCMYLWYNSWGCKLYIWPRWRQNNTCDVASQALMISDAKPWVNKKIEFQIMAEVHSAMTAFAWG